MAFKQVFDGTNGNIKGAKELDNLQLFDIIAVVDAVISHAMRLDQSRPFIETNCLGLHANTIDQVPNQQYLLLSRRIHLFVTEHMPAPILGCFHIMGNRTTTLPPALIC